MSGNSGMSATLLQMPKAIDEVIQAGRANDLAAHQAGVMAIYRVDDRRLHPTSMASSEKRLSVGISILAIAGCSVLSWGLVISIATALLRFGR